MCMHGEHSCTVTWRPDVDIEYLPQKLFTLYSETGSPTEANQFVHVAMPISSRDSASFPVLGITDVCHHAEFCMVLEI